MASFKKQRRISSFICLIMGLLILVSMFFPILNYEMTVGEEKHVVYTATPYDMLKAVLNKGSILPENVEQEIYKIVIKIDKDAALSSEGAMHSTVYKQLVEESKLYAYFAYFGALIALAAGAVMVVFGLFGTIMRAKLFKFINISASLIAIVGGALSIAGILLLGKLDISASAIIPVSIKFAYMTIGAPALLSIIGFMVFRPKRKRL